MLTGLNHITLAVRDIEKSLDFYTCVLGFDGHVKWDSGAYLSLGQLWLCLSLDQPDEKLDYTHIAFDIAESSYDEFLCKLNDGKVPIWKENKSEGKSVYILDPDGHKLEVHVGNLSSRLHELKSNPYKGLVWL